MALPNPGMNFTPFDTLPASDLDKMVANIEYLDTKLITDDQMSTEIKPVLRTKENSFDFISSGLVWSGDSYGSTRNASMTAGVLYINGQRMELSAITAHLFTSSKDTYIDVINTAGVASVVYTEVNNNAASPSLAANSIRIGIIVTGASSIAAVTSINQGQENIVLPIASSVPYTVTDSLGNLICPRDPSRRTLGLKQLLTSYTVDTSEALVGITGLAVPIKVPIGRKIKCTLQCPNVKNSNATNGYTTISIHEGAVSAGTQKTFAASESLVANRGIPMTASVEFTPVTSDVTITAGIKTAWTSILYSSAKSVIQLLVELK